MSKDFYKILGIDKTASKADIKKAFREAAKKHHPDKGGDAEKFKQINEAYETLSNDQKKQQYDTFGSTGAPNGFSGFGGFGNNGPQGQAYNVNFEDIGDIFGSFFGGGVDPFGRNGNWQTRPRRGSDLEVEAHLSFDESMEGVKKKFRSSYASGGTLEVEIPQGVDNGNTLKLRGKGTPGQNGGPAGDLYIHILVKDSKHFLRQGMNIVSDLSVPIFEALLGGEYTVKTFWGKETVVLPPLSRDGSLLTIAGAGVRKGGHRGDHLVKIIYEMPKKITTTMRDALEKLK